MKFDVSKCEYHYLNYCKCYRDNYGDCYYKCSDEELKDCYYKQLQQLKTENEELREKLEKIKRLCINKEEARLLYGYKDFDSYDIIRIIESEN